MVIGLLFIAEMSFGQSPSTYPGLTYTALGNMEKDGDLILIAGSCDQLFYSYDNGNSWEKTFLKSYGRSIGIIPNDPDHKFIMSYFGGLSLFDLEDGEIRDFSAEPEIEELGNFINVKIVDNTLYVFGNGAVLKTTLGDYTWESIYQDTTLNDYAYTVETTDDAILMGTRQGKIMKLDLASDQVTVLHDLGEWITDLSMGTNKVGYIDWRGGSILKTTDGWETYEELTNLPESINPIAFGENIVLTVNTNRIYRSMDGGMTSERILTANTELFGLTHDAHMTEDGELYLVGRNAMVVKTSDFGDSFEHLNPLIRSHFYASTMSDAGVGYVAGSDGQILKSTDYGLSWALVDIDVNGSTIYHLAVLNSGKLFIAAANDYFLVENNTIVKSEELSMEKTCYSKEDNAIYGLVSTTNGMSNVIKSTDDGSSWTTIAEEIEANYALSCSPGNRVYVPLQDGAFVYSEDGGATWEEKKYGDENIRAMQSLGGTELYISGRDLYKTTDGGATSEKIASGYAINNITMSSEDHYTVTIGQNSSTNLRETTDGGATFKTIFQNCTTTASSTLINNGTILLAQNNGHINVKQLSGTSSTFDESSLNAHMFYPNPTDGLIESKDAWSSLSIHGLDGRIIKYFDQYANTIDVSDLPTGMVILKALIGDKPQTQLLMIK